MVREGRGKVVKFLSYELAVTLKLYATWS